MNDEASVERPPLKNAHEIIERFGGIRPMATKTNIAVTTVQGWKKRNVIPGNRVGVVLAAAEKYGVSLTGLVPDANTKSNTEHSVDRFGRIVEKTLDSQLAAPPLRHEETYQNIRAQQQMSGAQPSGSTSQSSPHGYTELRVAADSKRQNRTVILSVTLMGLIMAAMIGILWPRGASHNSDLPELTHPPGDQTLATAELEQTDGSLFKGLVPEDWNDKLGAFKEQALTTAQSAQETLAVVSKDVLGENAGTLNERLVKLEDHAGKIVSDSGFFGLANRVEEMRSTNAGQSSLTQTMDALHGMITGGAATGETESDLALELEQARQDNPALAETFSGVGSPDLKAAAMLVTMMQLRDSLNRGNVPFEKDLQTLRGMVGNDNPELTAALDRIAPSAKEGVLSPGGLSKEFRTLAGEALSATLSGEDLSVTDRAQERFGEVFRIEKGGQSITGSQKAQIIEETKRKIQLGTYDEAIKYIQSLIDSEQFAPLRPWLKEVRSVLSKLFTVLDRAEKELLAGNYGGALRILFDNLDQGQLKPLMPLINHLENALSASTLEEMIRRLMSFKGQGLTNNGGLLQKN